MAAAGRCWATRRRRFAPSGRPSPTRARASSTSRRPFVARLERPAPPSAERSKRQMAKTKVEARDRRKASIRKKVSGTAERPRLSVFRSAKHIYVQVVDDQAQRTLLTVSTLHEALKPNLVGLNNTERARKVGTAIAD